MKLKHWPGQDGAHLRRLSCSGLLMVVDDDDDVALG